MTTISKKLLWSTHQGQAYQLNVNENYRFFYTCNIHKYTNTEI